MKKILSIFVTLAMALAANIALVVNSAEAVPAFARQMQMTCKGCHFQHFPKLNAMGRAFKANGYTDVAVETIDGDWHSSIPINLNASYVTKMRYQKNVNASSATVATGGYRGSLQFIDEGTLFIGGRVAEHVGAAIELGAGGNGAQHWGNGTIVFGADLETLNSHVGLALWAADAAGPFWGKEIFNTGLIRGARGMENRDQTQAAGMLYREADWQGITAYLRHDWVFAAFGLATPGFGPVDVGADMAFTYRVAITPPQIWGFETMVGVYGLFGGASASANADGGPSLINARYLAAGSTRYDANMNAHGVDFQAEGNITEGITLGLYGNILYDTGDMNDGRNYFTNGGRGHDFFRAQVNFDVGLLEDRLIAKFNYLYSSGRDITSLGLPVGVNSNRASVDIVSLGLYYNIRENVSLRPEISWVVGHSNPTGLASRAHRINRTNDTNFTLMLWYAF